jgi:hypothetical protein
MRHTATYSPEDNKLRLYVGRVPREEYLALKAQGWTSTPKQGCDFVATWTPEREDMALSYLEEGEDIGDEDYSPEERAADKAERLAGYRDKRLAEATGRADAFDAGPTAFGHQNRDRAERQARRHDRHRTHAVSQWSKAEYWQHRTAGVISHALHRSSASVRRGRILTLESERRKLVAGYTPTDNPPHIINQQAYSWSTRSYKYDGAEVPHVWVGPKGRGGHYVELASLEAIKAGSRRWLDHYDLRLTYERSMLEVEGGMAGDCEMEPGGWIGKWQIERVCKSPATGRVVSVHIRHDDGKLHRFNIERLGEGVYRAPTDAEREQFKVVTKERKAAEKASKPISPALINPTDEDAERLQAIWNSHAEERHKRNKAYGTFEPSKVHRMTQAQYSAYSKGTHSHYETVDVTEQLRERWSSAMGREMKGRVVIFKVRKAPSSGSMSYRADCVIVISDKPQKRIPWELAAEVLEQQPSQAKLLQRMGELGKALGLNWLPADGTEELKLIDDAVYVGWAYVSSMSQFGWTDAGMAAWREFVANPKQQSAKDRGPVAAGLLF